MILLISLLLILINAFKQSCVIIIVRVCSRAVMADPCTRRISNTLVVAEVGVVAGHEHVVFASLLPLNNGGVSRCFSRMFIFRTACTMYALWSADAINNRSTDIFVLSSVQVQRQTHKEYSRIFSFGSCFYETKPKSQYLLTLLSHTRVTDA